MRGGEPKAGCVTRGSELRGASVMSGSELKRRLSAPSVHNT